MVQGTVLEVEAATEVVVGMEVEEEEEAEEAVVAEEGRVMGTVVARVMDQATGLDTVKEVTEEGNGHENTQ